MIPYRATVILTPIYSPVAQVIFPSYHQSSLISQSNLSDRLFPLISDPQKHSVLRSLAAGLKLPHFEFLTT